MNQRISYYALPGLKPQKRVAKVDIIQQEKVIEVVCDHFGTTMEKLQRNNRYAETVLARSTLIHFLHLYTSLNKAQIGRLLKKNHTTVIHSLKSFENRIDVEDHVRNHVDAIKEKFRD